MVSENSNHPLIEKYTRRVFDGNSAKNERQFSGAVFRKKFNAINTSPNTSDADSMRHEVLKFNEDYLSWVDLFETVEANQKESFVLAELGAGYGRWMLNAACHIREHFPGVQIKLIGVEAESMHYRFMMEALEDNGIDPVDHRIVHSAIGDRSGIVWFYSGESSEWYGQSVMKDKHIKTMLRKNDLPQSYVPTLAGKILDTTIAYPNSPGEFRKSVSVQMISLDELLADIDIVDFMHADLQGIELDVIKAGRDTIDKKVGLIHIGTHSTEVEEGLRDVFLDLGWINRWDFARQGEHSTPFGMLRFGDGVQSWENPKFRSVER